MSSLLLNVVLGVGVTPFVLWKKWVSMILFIVRSKWALWAFSSTEYGIGRYGSVCFVSSFLLNII